MYRISKEFHFSAAHRLHGLPQGHPCGREHGHNYIIVLVLEDDELDYRSFVTDYGELSIVKRWIDEEIDHRHLNPILEAEGITQTSAENIARWMYETWEPHFPQLAAVRVSETPKTWAEYRP